MSFFRSPGIAGLVPVEEWWATLTSLKLTCLIHLHDTCSDAVPEYLWMADFIGLKSVHVLLVSSIRAQDELPLENIETDHFVRVSSRRGLFYYYFLHLISLER